jgi:hypothetical protein
VHEVDVRERDRDVAGDHHAGSERTVEDLDERDLALGGELPAVAAHRGSPLSGTKLYGAHGPLSSSSTPLRR